MPACQSVAGSAGRTVPVVRVLSAMGITLCSRDLPPRPFLASERNQLLE